MEMELARDSGVGSEFISETSSDSELEITGRANTVGENEICLDLLDTVGVRKYTRTEQAMRQMRRLSTIDNDGISHVIRKSDLRVPASILLDYSSKLLSDEDIDYLFEEGSALLRVLKVPRKRRAYIIAVVDPEIRNQCKETCGYVHVTPNACELMCDTGIGFGMTVEFPNRERRMIPLYWKLSRDGKYVILEYDEEEHDLIIVSGDEDDLVKFHLYFTVDEERVPGYSIMTTSLCIGKYNRDIIIDDSVISSALQRIYSGSPETFMDIMLTVSRDINEVIGIGINGEVYPTDTDGEVHTRQSSGYVTHLMIGELMNAAPTYGARSSTGGYHATDGWRDMGTADHSDCVDDLAGRFRTRVNVNVDDSIYNELRDIYGQIYDQVRQYNYRHAVQMEAAISQKSAPALDDGYITTDEHYITSVTKFCAKQQKQTMMVPAGKAYHESVARASFMTIHLYRTMFDEGAFPDIHIPEDMLQVIRNHNSYIISEQVKVNKYIAQNVIEEMRDREARHEIRRKILLTGWQLKCPMGTLERAIAQMISIPNNDRLWRTRRSEFEKVQQTNWEYEEQSEFPMQRLLRQLFTRICNFF